MLLSATSTAYPDDSKSDQWIYRTCEGCEAPHVAVFLSWDFSSVVFRAWCERHHQLVVQYFPQNDDGPVKHYGMKIVLDGRSHSMDRTMTDTDRGQVALTGRVVLNSGVVQRIQTAKDVDFDVPTANEEPFYTGRAEPLKRVVRECR